MFSRAAIALLTFVALFGSTLVHAVPLQPLQQRQVGNLECNVDRIQIVADLFGAASTAKKLTPQLSSDSTATSNIKTVSQGILDAQTAVGEIAIALIEGQAAPVAARDQVVNGIKSAQSALNQISSSDASTTKNLGTLGRQLLSASAAGAGVVANCV